MPRLPGRLLLAPPPTTREAAASWARSNFVYTTQMGSHGWRIDDEIWDFDLGPWLERQKLRWCAPGSGNAQLGDGCPINALSSVSPGSADRWFYNLKGPTDQRSWSSPPLRS